MIPGCRKVRNFFTAFRARGNNDLCEEMSNVKIVTLLPSSYWLALLPTFLGREERRVEYFLYAIANGPETVAIDVLLVLRVEGEGESRSGLTPYCCGTIDEVHSRL